MTRAPRIPGKHVVYIGKTPVVMTDSQYRDFIVKAEKKPHKERKSK